MKRLTHEINSCIIDSSAFDERLVYLLFRMLGEQISKLLLRQKPHRSCGFRHLSRLDLAPRARLRFAQDLLLKLFSFENVSVQSLAELMRKFFVRRWNRLLDCRFDFGKASQRHTVRHVRVVVQLVKVVDQNSILEISKKNKSTEVEVFFYQSIFDEVSFGLSRKCPNSRRGILAPYRLYLPRLLSHPRRRGRSRTICLSVLRGGRLGIPDFLKQK